MCSPFVPAYAYGPFFPFHPLVPCYPPPIHPLCDYYKPLQHPPACRVNVHAEDAHIHVHLRGPNLPDQNNLSPKVNIRRRARKRRRRGLPPNPRAANKAGKAEVAATAIDDRQERQEAAPSRIGQEASSRRHLIDLLNATRSWTDRSNQRHQLDTSAMAGFVLLANKYAGTCRRSSLLLPPQHYDPVSHSARWCPTKNRSLPRKKLPAYVCRVDHVQTL